MITRESTITKVRQLPESLLQEVSDFIDFVSVKQLRTLEEPWNRASEIHEPAASDFSTYLRDLEQYENRLARGDIQW